MVGVISSVTSGKMEINQAADQYGVPRTTLKDRLSGRVVQGANGFFAVLFCCLAMTHTGLTIGTWQIPYISVYFRIEAWSIIGTSGQI